MGVASISLPPAFVVTCNAFELLSKLRRKLLIFILVLQIGRCPPKLVNVQQDITSHPGQYMIMRGFRRPSSCFSVTNHHDAQQIRLDVTRTCMFSSQSTFCELHVVIKAMQYDK